MEILNRIYVKNSSVVTRKIADQIVLIPAEQEGNDAGSIFSLNDMAAGIWVQIDGETSLTVIKDRVIKTFEADSEKVEKDLLDFVSQLEKLNMIFCQLGL